MASIEWRNYRHQTAEPTARFGGWLSARINRLLFWRDLAHERRNLRKLDDRLLQDIGANRLEAGLEATRPFWDTAGLDRRGINGA